MQREQFFIVMTYDYSRGRNIKCVFKNTFVLLINASTQFEKCRRCSPMGVWEINGAFITVSALDTSILKNIFFKNIFTAAVFNLFSAMFPNLSFILLC